MRWQVTAMAGGMWGRAALMPDGGKEELLVERR